MYSKARGSTRRQPKVLPFETARRKGRPAMDFTTLFLLNLHLIESWVIKIVGLISVALFGRPSGH
jgi:hypothetical protein